MSGLLSRLIGRKAESASNIAAAMEAQRVAHTRAEAAVTASAQARAAALNDCDANGVALADMRGAEARIAVEVGARALEVLASAHAKAVEAERRRDQAKAAAELIAAGDALADDFRAEWDRSANVMAGLRQRAALHDVAIDNALFAGAIASDAVPHAEQFRGAVRFAETMPRIFDLSGDQLWPVRLPDSDRERARIEADAEHARQKAEREAKRAVEAAARDAERAAERQAERDLEDEHERRPYYPRARRNELDMAR